jgi:citrate lyase subunit beta / citryl-CoA lyase
LASGAGEVIVDLEDGVAVDDKVAARRALAEISAARPVQVRINAGETAHHEADLRAVAILPWVSAIVLPKVESAKDVAVVASALPTGIAILALVETACGPVAVEDIARAGIARVIFGSVDYLADIRARSSRGVLAHPRSRLVVASRAAGLPAPVDGPTLFTGDEGAVRADAEDAKAMGFGAKLCIQPAQVPPVNEVFGSSDEERRSARAVLEAAASQGGGAFAFEGAMVDEAVLIRARQLPGRG